MKRPEGEKKGGREGGREGGTSRMAKRTRTSSASPAGRAPWATQMVASLPSGEGGREGGREGVKRMRRCSMVNIDITEE